MWPLTTNVNNAIDQSEREAETGSQKERVAFSFTPRLVKLGLIH